MTKTTHHQFASTGGVIVLYRRTITTNGMSVQQIVRLVSIGQKVLLNLLEI